MREVGYFTHRTMVIFEYKQSVFIGGVGIMIFTTQYTDMLFMCAWIGPL